MKEKAKRRLCLLMVLLLMVNIFTEPVIVTAKVQVVSLQVKQLKKLPESKKLTKKRLKKSIKVSAIKNGKKVAITDYTCNKLGKKVTYKKKGAHKGRMAITIKYNGLKAKFWAKVKKAKTEVAKLENVSWITDKVDNDVSFYPTPTRKPFMPIIPKVTALPSSAPQATATAQAIATATAQATTTAEATSTPIVKVTTSPSPIPVFIPGIGSVVIKPTKKPDATKAPDSTSTPDATKAPDSTSTPDATEAPDSTSTPDVTKAPEATSTPDATEKPHEHEYKATISYVMIDNLKHAINTTNSCISCDDEYSETTEEEHELTEWEYDGNGKDIRHCIKCECIQEREHQHEEVSDSNTLEYACTDYNGDGTHKMEASYQCTICNELVFVYKNEECDIQVAYVKTGINDTHIVVSTCQICNNRTEETGVCEPTGELKVVKVNSQIYEYYDCLYCDDWCKRQYHTEHKWEPWEPHGDSEHIRYCICIEAREIEEHRFIIPMNDDGIITEDVTVVCEDCGYEKFIKAHDHKKGIKDDMNLMNLVMSDAYQSGECQTQSQVFNPNPGIDKWCSRYEFLCSDCGLKYYMTNTKHNMKDGHCTRGDCEVTE